MPSVRGVAKRPGAVRQRARAPGAVRACWRRAGRPCGGAGGNVPVFFLINDARAAARGSCALSLALGLAENGQGDGWRCVRQAHRAGARARTRPTLPAAGDRGPGTRRRSVAAISRVWRGQGTGVCSPSSCGATCHTRVASSRGGDRTRTGLQRGAGHRPPATVPAAWEGRLGRRGRQQRRGSRGRGTEGRTEAGWLRVGLTE